MRRAVAIALPLAVVLLLAIWRGRGPEPRDASAPANEFSSARAADVLRTLYAEEVPHPIGSPANARVRDRIVARFRELGYETRVERRFACNYAAMCANVENILAGAPNQPAGDPVLMVAHYDSVPAGPAVSDDGMGVSALLEIARATRGERFRNPVVFLIDDGEEAGLLGAEAYVAGGGKAGIVVNVENRGTRGPSNMFETSRGNRWMIAKLAHALPMPNATSFFYAVYELLPNDTDVTIFKRAGIAAVNFAAIGGVHWYHTPFDDIAHASPRTLQHHGDNLLGSLRAFANADLTARGEDNATYFDVLNFFLIHWPQGWTLWLGIVSLLLLVIAIRREPAKLVTFGILGTLLTIVLAVVLGLCISTLAALHARQVQWVARPLASIAAMWLTGFAAALFGFAPFRKWRVVRPVENDRGAFTLDGSRAMLAGAAVVWHALGIGLALAMPGAAFVFLVPAAVVSICLLVRANALVIAVAGATAAAILIYPMGAMLYDALGGGLMVAIAVLIAVQATLFAPAASRASTATLALLCAIAFAIVAVTQPAFDDAHPLQVSLAYVQDPAAPPMWNAGTVTPSLGAFAKWAPADPALTPWGPRRNWTAPAPALALPPVQMTAERGATSTTIHVRSQRSAPRMRLVFRGTGIGAIRVNGTPLAPRPARHREDSGDGWKFAMVTASPTFDVEIEVPASAKLEAIATDYTFGLPPGSDALQRARADSPAFPSHEGDVTVTRARGVF
jgi:hypothetical protein